MATETTSLEFIRKLSAVGIALSAEKDNDRLMERILQSAKDVARADRGTLYWRTDDNALNFEIMLTDSLNIHMGGTSGEAITLPPVSMYNDSGEPNNKNIAAGAAVSGETVNVPDAYDSEEFDFSGTREFDRKTGYRSSSFLTVPMRNHEDEVMGIADIFEALTAGDRPYKKPMPISLALTTLGRMKEENHVDPDLFDVFARKRVYMEYAEKFLKPEQIDEVDLYKVPGCELSAGKPAC